MGYRLRKARGGLKEFRDLEAERGASVRASECVLRGGSAVPGRRPAARDSDNVTTACQWRVGGRAIGQFGVTLSQSCQWSLSRGRKSP